MFDLLDRFDPWQVPRAEPTNLIIPWPGHEAPDQDDVVEALAGALGSPLRTEAIDPQAPEVVWSAGMLTQSWAAPLVAWVERARDLPPEAPPDARWVVGLETVLDQSAPGPNFRALLGIVRAMCPVPTAVLDVNTGRWLAPTQLAPTQLAPTQLAPTQLAPTHFAPTHFAPTHFAPTHFAPTHFAPTHFAPTQLERPQRPAQFLWITHVARRAAAEGVWLRTMGLARCARPELEMLDVPVALADVAAGLLDEVAELLLEEPAWPAPGIPFAIGPDLAIALSPWRVVAALLPRAAPGAAGDPGRFLPTYAGAVIGDASSECATWPRSAVERLAKGAVAIFRSAERTQAQAMLAQATWGVLAKTLARSTARIGASSGGPGSTSGLGSTGGTGGTTDVMVEAAFPSGAAHGGTEHLWFRVSSIDADSAVGYVVDHPLAGPLTREHARVIRRDQVSDWRVTGDFGTIDPHRAATLEQMLITGRRAVRT